MTPEPLPVELDGVGSWGGLRQGVRGHELYLVWFVCLCVCV